MRLTPRCLDLLRLLVAARWLTTGQVHRRFFTRASLDAARKRLRKLVAGKYLRRVQRNRMSEVLFTLEVAGTRELERRETPAITLETRPPKHLEHFIGVNDVRLLLEAELEPSYFFAYWELPSLRWSQAIIPDALFGVDGSHFAVEFDRGMESISYFVRTKIEVYRRGLDGLPLRAVLILADRETRMKSLMKAVQSGQATFAFSTIDWVRTDGIDARAFCTRRFGASLPLREALFSGSLVVKSIGDS